MPTYYGTPGDDRLTGQEADDIFIATAGSDNVDGGSGTDTVDYSALGAIAASFSTETTGTVTKSGPTTQTDSLRNVNRLIGSSYNDVFSGSASGRDFLYFVGGPGQDTIYGHGNSFNVADYSDAREIVVDAFRGTVFNGGFPDVLVSVTGFQGSPGNDLFFGAEGRQVFRGGAGDDEFRGRAGDDIINGQAGTDVARFDAPLSALTIRHLPFTSPSNLYVSSAEDGLDLLVNVERISAAGITYGGNDRVSGMNTLHYFASNADVVRAGLDAEAHYNASGWREGRDPNAWFSTSAYLAANPDVAAAGMNPLQHYLASGWREGRDPSALLDNETYLARNPEARAAGTNPLLHLLSTDTRNATGTEVRQTHPAIGADAGLTGFDRQWYLMTNRDVAASGMNPETHYRSFGFREGRSPDAWFDSAGYRAAYADVAVADIDPLQHYLTFGWRENRDPSLAFDTGNYLAANPDVAAAGMNPLLHFLGYGAAEGRAAIGDQVFG